MITFEGFRWTEGQARNLPVKNVAPKILCSHHNSALTSLDSIAQTLFETGARFHNHQFDRGLMNRSAIWSPDRATFDGFQLERLFAKIAVGVIHEDPDVRWYPTGSIGLEPPPEIIEVIYGLRKFRWPMGFYFVNSVGDQLKNEDRVAVHSMLHPQSGEFIGAIIAMRHWEFFINLSDLDPKEYSMEAVSGKRIGINGTEPLYRVGTINFNAKGKLSGQIRITWAE